MGHSQSEISRDDVSLHAYHKSVTPLYEACRDGDEERVRILLPQYSHADLNRSEYVDDGNTCLHIATANGHDGIVKLLLKHGCYRTSVLNSRKQSPYDMATLGKESTRLLFQRHDENNPSSQPAASRFSEQSPSECFDIVQVDENQRNDEPASPSLGSTAPIQTYKTEAERKRAMEYSACSKTMCQRRFTRFCVNLLHSDEPLDRGIIKQRLQNALERLEMNGTDDEIKVTDLVKQYSDNSQDIEQLLHLYTLETKFYQALKQDCLPLAIPLFMHLPKLKERFFQGRTYRGIRMTHEQFSVYRLAMETPGTLLQTRLFSSTSIDRQIAEQFAFLKSEGDTKELCVLFILDFPEVCDQAINLSRISLDRPCLSEYENEREVLVLPWTIFEVTRVRKHVREDHLCKIYLTNVVIPGKSISSSFKWSCADFTNTLIKEKRIAFDCAFQKYKK